MEEKIGKNLFWLMPGSLLTQTHWQRCPENKKDEQSKILSSPKQKSNFWEEISQRVNIYEGGRVHYRVDRSP